MSVPPTRKSFSLERAARALVTDIAVVLMFAGVAVVAVLAHTMDVFIGLLDRPHRWGD